LGSVKILRVLKGERLCNSPEVAREPRRWDWWFLEDSRSYTDFLGRTSS